MSIRAAIVAAAALLLANAPAWACLPLVRPLTMDETRAVARSTFDTAPLIVDAVIAEPTQNGVAILKVLRVLKGKAGTRILVGPRNSCDLGLERKGAHIRVVLRPRGDGYGASYDDNGVYIYGTDGQEQAFAEEIDRLLGKPRPR